MNSRRRPNLLSKEESGLFFLSILCLDWDTQPSFLMHLRQPAVGELLEEMALTGKLELCVGEGSAKGKPFLKELT